MTSMKVLSLLLLMLMSSPGVSPGQVFHVINGSLCIRPEFTRNEPRARSDIECSNLCSMEPRCQAFSLADGPCQLFVFDKCSKSVRDCGCSRRGRVFVKRQTGLEPGALCPSDFGDDHCGVKYKLFNATNTWAVQRQRCESESGLVIMADVIDSAELAAIGQVYNTKGGGVAMWVGGFQTPGSAEPNGGWRWVACNISFDASLWATIEPNNYGGSEDAVFASTVLGDAPNSNTNRAGLCECLSPFD